MDNYGAKPKKLSGIPAHVSRLPLGINFYWLCDAPTGLTFKNFTFCHTLFVFRIYLRTNCEFCPI